jgi:hypothetical protein
MAVSDEIHVYEMTITGDVTGNGLIILPATKSEPDSTFIWFQLVAIRTGRESGYTYRLATSSVTGNPYWDADSGSGGILKIRFEAMTNADICEEDSSLCEQAWFQFNGNDAADPYPSSVVIYEAWDVDDGTYNVGHLALRHIWSSSKV